MAREDLKAEGAGDLEGVDGIYVVDGLPAAGGGGVDVFFAIVDVEEVGAAQFGNFFDDFVDARGGFHDAMFVGKNVGIEFVEKWKTFFDEANAEVVGVGENVAWNFFATEFFVPGEHLRGFSEDVAEEFREFVERSAVAGEALDFGEVFFGRHVAVFEFIEQRRGAENIAQFGFGDFAFVFDALNSFAVIEIEEDVAEIEDDGFGTMGFGHWITGNRGGLRGRG